MMRTSSDFETCRRTRGLRTCPRSVDALPVRDDPLNPVVEGLGRLLARERLGEGTTEDHRGVESGPLSCFETLGELEGVLVRAADAVCDAFLPCSDGGRVEVMDLA